MLVLFLPIVAPTTEPHVLFRIRFMSAALNEGGGDRTMASAPSYYGASAAGEDEDKKVHSLLLNLVNAPQGLYREICTRDRVQSYRQTHTMYKALAVKPLPHSCALPRSFLDRQTYRANS